MNKFLKVSAFFAIGFGLVLVIAGFWGLNFTYQNVSRENIFTPEDAFLPNEQVRTPLTLKAQADVIRAHTLKITNGKTYAEMPRMIPKTDESGAVLFDEEGKPIMIENTARQIWITALTLTTSLNLAIITYAFSGLILFLGFVSLWTGWIFYKLSKKTIN